MFKIDDIVVYENAGVCRIENIGIPDFIKTEDVYYKLQSLDTIGNTIYVKIVNEQMMRYTISKETAKGYLDTMSSLKGIYKDDNKSREREFLDILKSKSWIDCLKMFKGIQQVKVKRELEGKHLNANDDRNMAKVDKMICSELSIAMEIPVEEIRNQLIQACN